jgi:hypothetical protein
MERERLILQLQERIEETRLEEDREFYQQLINEL